MPQIPVVNNSLALIIAKNRWLRRLNIFNLPDFGVVSWKSWPFYIYLKDWSGPSFHILNSGVDSYESESYRILIKILSKNSVFFDIGANVGIFTFKVARDAKDASVFAFEPEPYAHECIKKTIAANGLQSVSVHNHALSDSEGTATFYFDKQNHGGHSLDETAIIRDGSIISHKLEVTRTTLDSFVRRQGIVKVDVIKLDVQRHEEAVLKGAAQTIRQHRPIFLIECFVDELNKEPSPLIQPFIEAGEYMIFDPSNGKKSTTKNPAEILESCKDQLYRDLFFVPAEKIHLFN